MAKLIITINMDNAAFEDTPEIEAARILSDLAARIKRGAEGFDDISGFSLPLMDYNGNKVGTVTVD